MRNCEIGRVVILLVKNTNKARVTLHADWFDGGPIMTINTGGNYSWTQVYPKDK